MYCGLLTGSHRYHLHAVRSTPNERVSSNAYILRALFCEVARQQGSIMYTFIYRKIRRHGYAALSQLPNYSTEFPYIHSHTQSHSPLAPPWPSSPALCGLDLAVNQSASLLAPSFSPVARGCYPPTPPRSE